MKNLRVTDVVRGSILWTDVSWMTLKLKSLPVNTWQALIFSSCVMTYVIGTAYYR